MHTIRFRMKLNKLDEEVLYQRFFLIWCIHNQLVKHAQKLMNVLHYDRTYIGLKKAYASVAERKKGCPKAEKERLEAEFSLTLSMGIPHF